MVDAPTFAGGQRAGADQSEIVNGKCCLAGLLFGHVSRSSAGGLSYAPTINLHPLRCEWHFFRDGSEKWISGYDSHGIAGESGCLSCAFLGERAAGQPMIYDQPEFIAVTMARQVWHYAAVYDHTPFFEWPDQKVWLRYTGRELGNIVPNCILYKAEFLADIP